MKNFHLKEFLHWTPLGILTVPVFIVFGNDDKSDGWLVLNGMVIGTWFTTIILCL